MELGQDVLIYVFGALAIGIGARGFMRGEITYGIDGGSSDDDRTLHGGRARLVSALLVASGLALFFSMAVGICMVIGAVILPWLIGD